MDINTLLATGGMSGGTIAVLVLLYKIGQKIMNHRIVAQCCNRECELGIAIEDYNVSNSNDKERPLVENNGHSVGNTPPRQEDSINDTPSGTPSNPV